MSQYPVHARDLHATVLHLLGIDHERFTHRHQGLDFRLGRNRLRIAGTAEFNGDNRDILERRVRPLIRWAEEHFPQVSTENCVPWAGLRPMTPEGTPILGKTRFSNLWMNTGQGHMGWTMSHGASRIVADLIAGKPSGIPLDGMTLQSRQVR